MIKQSGEGIKETQIENYSNYKSFLESFGCPICLEIVKNPVECTTCQTLYCDECWDRMKIDGQPCTMKCSNSKIGTANKFVYSVLSKLKITCEICGKSNIDYNLFVIHREICEKMESLISSGEINRQINKKELQLADLNADLENSKISMSNINYQNQEDSEVMINQIRKQLLSFGQSANVKGLLYEATIKGKISEYKDLILNKKIPIFEEVSSPGYLWTSVHYAMHYGQEEIIFFALNYIDKQLNVLDNAVKLVSKDGRCLINCLLKSNAISIEIKKSLIVKIIKAYPNLKFTESAERELRVRKFDTLYSRK